jgi:ATP-dependent DNA ligase
MLPAAIQPMLAQRAPEPFDSEDYLFEIKWDGIRCLAFIEAGRLRLQSRDLMAISAQFPELASLAQLPSGTVLDGELVVLKDGKPCFAEIQKRTQLRTSHRIGMFSHALPVSYLVFDLLYWEGESLVAAPLSARREALNSLTARLPESGVLVSGAVLRYGRACFETVAKLGLEGLMAKRLDSPYVVGRRSRHWLKIKPLVTSRGLRH